MVLVVSSTDTCQSFALTCHGSTTSPGNFFDVEFRNYVTRATDLLKWLFIEGLWQLHKS